MQGQPNPGLPHPETPLLVGVGEVRLVSPLEIRDVLTPQLDEAAPLQRVERLDNTGAAEVDRAKTTLFLLRAFRVLRMGRPAVVERALGILGDLPDRGTDRARVPAGIGQPFVDVRIKQHRKEVKAVRESATG